MLSTYSSEDEKGKREEEKEKRRKKKKKNVQIGFLNPQFTEEV